MAEKYITCNYCKGSGSIEVEQRDPIFLRKTITTESCPACLGQGGEKNDAYHYEWGRDFDAQKEMEDILDNERYR